MTYIKQCLIRIKYIMERWEIEMDKNNQNTESNAQEKDDNFEENEEDNYIRRGEIC